MAKRKLPKVLKVRRECAVSAGVKPFTKETPSQKRDIQECVDRRMGK